MAEHPAPVAVVVLTFNEERNLGNCLASVATLAAEVVVVDSGSADRTCAIAREFGAAVVEHPFETHARQWRWALQTLQLRSEWVLGLDADQRLTPELAEEIRRVLGQSPTVDGFFIARRQVFRGRWIKHGGYYPKYLLKLFRRGAARLDEGDLVDHHFRVDGPVGRLRHDLIEDNLNEHDITAWIAKHNRYARLQAEEEWRNVLAPDRPQRRGRLLGTPDERVQWLKANVWRRLPLYVRPALYFFYRYVLRLGFLDGKEGFVFHFLQAYWYRLLVDINLDELRSAGPSRKEVP